MSQHKPFLHAGTRAPFIAFAGVMGVGKSSLARGVAKCLGGHSLVEPEADTWPVPKGERWEDHVMLLERWVHDTNLSLFQQASRTAVSGILAVADGGLFVLAKEYMDDPACQFYYGHLARDEMQQLRETACADWRDAPCPDIMVVIEADLDTWRQMIQKRGRSMDANQGFIASYHGQQRIIRSAAESYAAEKGIKLLRFTNQWSDPDTSAQRLAAHILELCR